MSNTLNQKYALELVGTQDAFKSKKGRNYTVVDIALHRKADAIKKSLKDNSNAIVTLETVKDFFSEYHIDMESFNTSIRFKDTATPKQATQKLKLLEKMQDREKITAGFLACIKANANYTTMPDGILYHAVIAYVNGKNNETIRDAVLTVEDVANSLQLPDEYSRVENHLTGECPLSLYVDAVFNENVIEDSVKISEAEVKALIKDNYDDFVHECEKLGVSIEEINAAGKKYFVEEREVVPGPAVKSAEKGIPNENLRLVREDGMNLGKIKNPDFETCMAAVKQNVQAYQYLPDPAPVFKELDAEGRKVIAENIMGYHGKISDEKFADIVHAVADDADPNIRALLAGPVIKEHFKIRKAFPDVVKKIENDCSKAVQDKLKSYIHNLPEIAQTETERLGRENKQSGFGKKSGIDI